MLVKIALQQIFSAYFSIHCQFSFRQFLYNYHLSEPGTVGQLVALRAGRSLPSKKLPSTRFS
jgi:hypothetical protein